MSAPETYTAREIAQALKVRVESFHQMRYRGAFPVEPIRIGRALRFPKEKTDAFLRGESADTLPPIPAGDLASQLRYAERVTRPC